MEDSKRRTNSELTAFRWSLEKKILKFGIGGKCFPPHVQWKSVVRDVALLFCGVWAKSKLKINPGQAIIVLQKTECIPRGLGLATHAKWSWVNNAINSKDLMEGWWRLEKQIWDKSQQQVPRDASHRSAKCLGIHVNLRAFKKVAWTGILHLPVPTVKNFSLTSTLRQRPDRGI